MKKNKYLYSKKRILDGVYVFLKNQFYVCKLLLISAMLFVAGCEYILPTKLYSSCKYGSDEYQKASRELNTIYFQDQTDRKNFSKFSSFDLRRLAKRDEQRRIKVASLFAKGCLKSANDFKKAGIVFQHGNVPEHFYQAFLWFNRAVKLGDKNAQHLVNLSIDRFLINSGHKQLFGLQAIKPSNGKCWCLYPTESSFSDEERVKRNSKTMDQQVEWLKKLNQTENCPNTECAMKLKAVSKADFPEFW